MIAVLTLVVIAICFFYYKKKYPNNTSKYFFVAKGLNIVAVIGFVLFIFSTLDQGMTGWVMISGVLTITILILARIYMKNNKLTLEEQDDNNDFSEDEDIVEEIDEQDN